MKAASKCKRQIGVSQGKGDVGEVQIVASTVLIVLALSAVSQVHGSSQENSCLGGRAEEIFMNYKACTEF